MARHDSQLAQNLKSALGQYSSGDREKTGIDEAEAVRVLRRQTIWDLLEVDCDRHFQMFDVIEAGKESVMRF
jgi:hypothetical protein